MNIYSWIILSTLFGSFLLSMISEILNLKALQTDLPAEFSGVYDAKAYEKSQKYTRTTTKFGFIVASFDLTILLLFWFSGSFNTLDKTVTSLGFGAIATGIIYIGLLLIAKFFISLPFSVYSTFVIEERFGFNKTTPATFVKDIIKGILLGTILGGGLLAAILAIFEYGGPFAWLYCWGAVTTFTIMIQFIAPTWIMPLFNKFEPLTDGELRKNIMSYARSVKFSLENVFVIDGSKRSNKSNAFFTGFGKHKRIALFDTLIAKHSTMELVAILAHEIGHYKKKHIIKGMCISIGHMGVMFYLISIFLQHNGLFSAFFMENMSIYAGLIFFGMLFSPIELILAIFVNMMSRAHEFEADKFAAETLTADNSNGGELLIAALKKLSVHNLANLTPHPIYVFLNYSHPPLAQRVSALKTIK